MASDVSGETPVTPHRFRFLTVYSVLGLALGIAAAALAIGLTTIVRNSPPWSTWKPSGGGLGSANQIAAHVGGEYRLPDGTQMDDVIAKAPSVSANGLTIPVGYVAIKGTHGKFDQLYPVSGSNSVMYTLCGLGDSCTIASGSASAAGGDAVRREILELALYTFHYVGGTQSVIALVPPKTPSVAATLVYLRRSDLQPELGPPLHHTLGPTTVDSTTSGRSYSFTLTRAPDGNTVLVLSPAGA